MQIAERLYTQGYISYPRTETTQYADGFGLVATLEKLKESNFWGDAALDLLKRGIARPRSGHDAGDHVRVFTPFAMYNSLLNSAAADLSPCQCRTT